MPFHDEKQQEASLKRDPPKWDERRLGLDLLSKSGKYGFILLDSSLIYTLIL
jgi:hypothetical protein